MRYRATSRQKPGRSATLPPTVSSRGLRRLLVASLLLVVALVPAVERAVDTRPARAEPTASGAEALYPPNHTFDADVQEMGTPPSNHDFETGGYGVGTPPSNHDLQQGATDEGAPANYDFAAGLGSWTTTGTVTLQSDANQGNYARFDASGAMITSDAFTVGATAQVLSYDIGFLSTTGSSWVRVKVLSGPTYSTVTEVGSYSCNSCGYWQTQYANVSSWLGQSIKLRFERGAGSLVSGVDTARAQTIFPNYDLVGTVSRRSDGGNVYATLEAGTTTTITTAAFTVDAAAQYSSVKVKGLTANSDQYNVYVLSGSGFATSTLVTSGTAADSDWETASFNLTAWAGQQVKLQVKRVSNKVAVDDLGPMRVDVAGWLPSKTAQVLSGGPSGSYVSIDGNLTSSAFTIPAGTQQLKLAYKGETSPSIFYVELLRGPDFATVTDINGGSSVSGDPATWQTFHAAVQDYAGETVKLRLRQYWGRGQFDTAGTMELAVPGWTFQGAYPVVTGSDASGTYVRPYKNAFYLRSADVNTGIVDTTGYVEQRYYAVSYAIGSQVGSLIRVTWKNYAGQSWDVLLDASDTPTGYRTKYFPLTDFQGATGYFVVQVSDPAGKLYAIADNLARQQLQEPHAQKVGFGIDAATGGFSYAERDLELEGQMPLTFRRFYVGQSDRYGTLGYRWSHSYDTRLEFAAGNDVVVVFGSGGQEAFDWNATTSTYSATDPRHHDELVKNPDGSYTFKTKITYAYTLDPEGNPTGIQEIPTGQAAGPGFDASGRLDTVTGKRQLTVNRSYLLDATGKLLSVTDLNNNTITLAYDASNRLATVTDPDGRLLTLAYNASGLLSSVTAPAGAVVGYAYDVAGDLQAVTDPDGGVRTYSYSRHRLTQAVDQLGKAVFTNALDSYNRVTSQTDPLSNTIALSYNTPAKGVTTVTDPLGSVARYYYDLQHRTTDKVDPLGRVISYLFDSNGNLQKVIDPVNNQWQFAYDANGRLSNMTDPLGNPLAMTWNTLHLPSTITDARGYSTNMTYDGSGNLLTVTDPLGNTTTYTYDAKGRVLTATNPLGQTETYTYDVSGNLTSRTEPLGGVWAYTYDGAGRVLTETNPLGQQKRWAYRLGGQLAWSYDELNHSRVYGYSASGALVFEDDELGNRTLWTYDDRGLPVQRTDPAGKVTTYVFDGDRRLTSETDPLGRVTSYGYDASGRVTSVTDPAGATSTYAYNAAGRLAAETDPLGRTTSYTYDNAGRLLTLTSPSGAVTTNTYDAVGNLIVETDALGRSTTHLYDALNRRTRVTDPLLNQTNFAFDAAGRMTQVTNALNQTTTYAHDANGRLTSVTNPLGQATTYQYDGANRRTGVSDPLGRTTAYGYDIAGRLTTVTNPAGQATTYAYDAAGRRTSVTRPSGAVTSSTFDPRGLLLTETNPLNQVTSYAYDNAGQQASVTDPLGRATTYAYDGAGREISLTDPLGGVVQFAYDAAGQRTSVTNANAKITTYAYDTLGNTLTETDPLGRVDTYSYDSLGRLTSSIDARGVIVAYGYDSADRLVAKSYPGGSVTYAYDALGRRTSMADATGTMTWTYDAAGRTASVAASGGTVSYGYDVAGQRTSMTLPGARSVSYAYDLAGRMSTLTDWNSQTVTFAYDADGRRTGITRPNGVVSGYAYDAASRVTSIAHTLGANTLASFGYGYDAVGNRSSTTYGGQTESYTLDALNRITSVAYPGGPTVSYTYDAHGNRLTKVQGGVTTTYAYDNAGQLTSDGTKTYTYDADGNLIGSGTDTFAYDWSDRMTSAVVGGVTSTYAYDADDTRTAKTVGGSATTYLWDRESGLPLLVDDGANSYLHADGVVQSLAAGGAAQILSDALGSVRGVTDGTGTTTATADYDVFGAIRTSTGTQSAFGFSGEQSDPESGYTYLRARYLDPVLGRMTAPDTVQPNAPGTQGWNLYAYVANNPTTWVDPTGHAALGEYRPLVGAAGGLALLGLALRGAFDKMSCAFNEWCRSAYITISKVVDSASDGIRQRLNRCQPYNIAPPHLLKGNADWGWTHILARHGAGTSTRADGKLSSLLSNVPGLYSLLAAANLAGASYVPSGRTPPSCRAEVTLPFPVGTSKGQTTSRLRIIVPPWPSMQGVTTMYPIK
ncbi:MAG: RHS repeat protein [Chloroflexi bacterium]|nr:RHS repeat protein [Chloroflexota bacterium]